MTATNGTVRNHNSIEGLVEATNERGVKIDGEWINVSKFRPVDLPHAGAHVRVDVDSKGFIKSLEVLDQVGGAHPMPAPLTRDATITRLAVLKAAAAFAAGRGDIKSSDVLRICDSWLAWVSREGR